MAWLDPVAASRAVLIEVENVLGDFRNDLVVVGGSVPDLLFPDSGHQGTLDVDLAVSPNACARSAYETIARRMINAGYCLRTDPTRFEKPLEGLDAPVKVDLICGEYHGAGKSRAVHVDEMALSSLRGIDLAFEAWEEK